MIQIPLAGGLYAVADDEDVWLLQHSWSLTNAKRGPGHPKTNIKVDGKYTTALMSRMILGMDRSDPALADHENGDTLDHRRANLRRVTRVVNGRNRSGAQRSNTGSPFLGVTWNRRDQRFQARIKVEGVSRSLGYFETAEQANAARLAAEKELWGIQPRRAEAHGETT